MNRLDRQNRVSIHPCQKPKIRERAGISKEECEATAWAVEANGKRHAGAAAINQAIAYALNTKMPMRIYHLPGVGWLQDWLYDLIAGLRHWLPGVTPYCQRFPAECRD